MAWISEAGAAKINVAANVGAEIRNVSRMVEVFISSIEPIYIKAPVLGQQTYGRYGLKEIDML